MNVLSVAVVGSGPAGVYVADELTRQLSRPVEVDVYDRLPTPYGLVRYGVAPDHPQIKSVILALRRVLEHPSVRFIGNVEIGRDVSMEELREQYEAVVLATGAPHNQDLGVPGEHMAGVFTAADLVSWYSGHPDARALDVSLAGAKSVTVVGAGNVALDVARLLAKPHDALEATDMPDHVIATLAASDVREVHVVCRRGPEHAKFTTKELRELSKLDDVEVSLRQGEVTTPAGDLDPKTNANLAVLTELEARQVPGAAREIVFHFWRRPVEMVGTASLTGVVVESTEPAGGADETDVVRELIASDAVVSAIGFRRTPIDGVPFDAESASVRHDEGRVLDAGGSPVESLYVAGWLKRGPSGVIGTNRADAAETVRSMVHDLADRAGRDGARDRSDLLHSQRGLDVVDYARWQLIDDAEMGHASPRAADRIKLAEWDQLLAASKVAPTKEEGA